ncbi:MAG: 16S rRNA methyltransferase [Treponema sp.]|jgi:16S rRNA (cytosine1407-C5)-methyltransferase|nr:16S rRNA methyltransferase [Treponema sp.]
MRLRQALFEDAALVAFSCGLSVPYFLNRASILAAHALRMSEAGTVLDACAAPGGKSLVLASGLNEGQSLLANELSSERRGRLARVLDEHLGAEKRRRVRVSGFDAARLAGQEREHGRFAGILLDAPCSSERYVLRNEKALAEWTNARPRYLAQRQWALLSAAFLLLAPGASLVYATCAISAEENDGVVSRLMKKYTGEVVLDEPAFKEGEKTTFGRLILPDETNGMGPMYIARVWKNRKLHE